MIQPHCFRKVSLRSGEYYLTTTVTLEVAFELNFYCSKPSYSQLYPQAATLSFGSKIASTQT